MNDSGLGVLAISCNVDPAHDAKFNEWYQRQQVPERLGVPGFIEARRYEARGGTPRYLAFYRLDSVEALTWLTPASDRPVPAPDPPGT
jgi:antibiotic biosynthesis monooxygenase (ABM) superfamily enzyme